VGIFPVNKSEVSLVDWQQSDSSKVMRLRQDSAKEAGSELRWSRKKVLIIGVLAALATIFQFLALGSVDRGAGSAAHVSALVASRALKSGRPITSEDFIAREVSADECFSFLATGSDSAGWVGKSLANDHVEGRPLFLGQVHPLEGRRALLSSIPSGRRLFSLSFSDRGMARALKRGDRVDVVGNLNLPGKGFVTRILLADSTVAGVERFTSESEVFFFVTPADVEFLTYAQRHGQLSLVFRNPDDTGEPSQSGVNSDGMTESHFLDDERIRDVYEGDLFRIKKGEVK
jgi:Flp pilus assembly protein CpaB